MFNEFYSLYTDCFPDYPLSYEDFSSMTDIDSATVFEEREKDKLIGFAIVGKQNISVIAVDKSHRRKGVGERLLKLSEEHLINSGIRKIALGTGTNDIFQGVPMDNGGTDVSDFFVKRGYRESHITYNMDVDTADFDYNALPIPKPKNITYRLAERSDFDGLLKAVEQVLPEWVPLFRECDDEVFLATSDSEIAGFLMLSEQGGIFTKNAEKHGCIGCVGTVPKYRKQGIGLDMTARAVQLLKERGCDKVQLLYLVLDKWYGRLGFYVTATQRMCEKEV